MCAREELRADHLRANEAAVNAVALQPAIVGLLAVLVLGIGVLTWQAWRLNQALEPILSSSIAQGLAAI